MTSAERLYIVKPRDRKTDTDGCKWPSPCTRGLASSLRCLSSDRRAKYDLLLLVWATGTGSARCAW